MKGVSASRVRRVYALHGSRCVYCDRHLHYTRAGIPRTPFSEYGTVDHRIPLERGGTNDVSNLLPACRLCNSRKHTKTELEFDTLREEWQCLSS